MAVENNVYLAKLAEQAERYEGKTVPLYTVQANPDLTFYRDGGVHEERGLSRSGALGRGAQPFVGRLQERHWGETCIVENCHVNRAKRGVQG